MKNHLQKRIKPGGIIHSLFWLFIWVASVDVAKSQNGLAFMHGADDNSGAGTGVSIWVSNGDGTFKQTKLYDTGFDRNDKGTEVFGDDNVSATFYVDATGDGVVDIVHVTEVNGLVAGRFIYVYAGTGKGGFSKTPIVTSGLSAGTDGYGFAGVNCCEQSRMGDVDGDGDIDYTFSGSDNKVNVYLNNGNGTFAPTSVVTALSGATGYFASGVTTDEVGFLADVNNDGKADLIHTNQFPNTIKVWLATSAGSFNPTPITNTGFANTGVSVFTGKGGNETSAIVDVTGDGKLDFVHANEFSGQNTVYVFAGDGLGGFATTFTSSVLNNPPGTFNYVIGDYGAEFGQWVDVTSDGKPDFVTSHDGLGTNSGIYVYANTGTGSFTATPIVSNVGCSYFQTGNDLTETTEIVKVFSSGTSFAANGRPQSVTNSPGGVADGLITWLRAEDLNSISEGAKVPVWSDAITGGQSVMQAVDYYRPTYNKTAAAKLVNYNPTLSFNGYAPHYMWNDHRLYCDNSPFYVSTVAVDERNSIHEYRGPMGIGSDGNYPALDLYTDAYSPNGWRPWMSGSSPAAWTGGNALLFNKNTGGTNRQPQIFALHSANASPTINYSVDNVISSVDSYSQATTLDAFQQNQIGNYLWVGSSGGEYWMGRIPEVLVYSRQITNSEQIRVNSYLATKYGITLDQRTATNYVASDGTIFWNAATNGIYKNNIGSIGRDDASGLNQKQSKSVNIQVQPILSIATIVTSNSANGGTFGADKSFASWGDDGRPHSYSTVYTPTSFTPAGGVGFYRMAATWKIQQTGSIGTSYYVGIPASSFADRLLISSTNSFGSGTQEIALVTDGNGNLVTASPVTIQNGYFFTFGAAEKAPGGVVNGLNVWLKADALSGDNGDKVDRWTSSVLSKPYAVSQATVSLQPSIGNSTSALVNYNQSVMFNSAAAQYLENNSTALLSGSQPSFHFISVGKDQVAPNYGPPYYGASTWRSMIGNGTSYTNPAITFNKDGASPNGWNPNSNNSFGAPSEWYGGFNTIYNGGGPGAATDLGVTQSLPTGSLARLINQQPQIMGLSLDYGTPYLTNYSSTTTNVNSWVDGRKQQTEFKYLYQPYLTAANFRVGLPWGHWNGPINEVIQYTRELSDAEMAKVNTYLGIKYGVTLGQGGSSTALIGSNVNSFSYVATDGTVVWSPVSNAGYAFDIAGIGQDNFEGLNQKQSKSVNAGFQPAIGLGSVAATNDVNPATFTADKNYMVWGSNGEASEYAVAYTPNSYTPTASFKIMNRVWKVQETGTVGTVAISIPGSQTGTFLLVSNSNSFSTGSAGVTEYLMTPDGSGNVVAMVDLTNAQFFTFGRDIVAPGCVTQGLALWVRGDDPGAVIGQPTQAWPDYSPNAQAVPSSGTMTVSTPDASHNFHPFFTGFSTNNYFLNANSVISPNNDNSSVGGAYIGSQTETDLAIFAVVKPSGNNVTGRITGIDNEAPTDVYAAEPGVSLYLGASNFYKYSGVGFNPTYTGDIPGGQNAVMSWNAKNGTASSGALSGTLTMGQNGVEQTFGSAGTFGMNGTRLAIGYGTWNVNGAFPGDIQEVIWYRTSLALTDRQKIQSYLALKYGVTLPHNYLSGNGTTIYNVSSYSANVTGVGRDDCQLLNQKQSKSGNGTAKMTISISNTLASSNATNAGSFTADATFITFGDNNLTGTAPISQTGSCPPPPLVDKVTNLAYKVTETGNAPAAWIREDVSGFGFNTSYIMYMQVYSDAAFTNLLASVPMSYTNGFGTAIYDFPANATSYVRFAGNTTAPANMCVASKPQTFHWNRWWYGTKQQVLIPNYIPVSSSGTAEMTMSVTVSDGGNNNLLYKPTVDWWPVFDGYGIFIPRNDNNSISGPLSQNNSITTRMQFRQGTSTSVVSANSVDFLIYDVDGWWWSRDLIKVYGKQGANTITPKLTQYKPTVGWDPLLLNYSGDPQQAAGGLYPWDLSVWGRVYVSFDSPVEEVFVEYRKDNRYTFNVYNDMRIGPVTVTCAPPKPKAPLADNIYVYKTVSPNPQKTDEPATYKFTVQNTNCGSKTVDLTDNLPGGLTWIDSTFVYSTSLTVGSVNNYGNTSTLQLSNVTVPPGTHYFYATAKGTTPGAYNNQASYVVTNGTGATYLSDDPSVEGTSAQPTPLTLIDNDPDANLTVTKTVSAATAPQNGTLTYTYTITNPNASSAVMTNFNDVLPGELTYIGGSLSGLSGGYVSSTAVTPYSGSAVLTMRSLSIPANSSLTFTIQANVNSYTIGAVANNMAQVITEMNSGFRIKSYNSTVASTTISEPPTVTISSPLNTTTALNPTVSGTATPGSTVVLTSSSGGTLCTTTSSSLGAWSCPVNLTAGPQTLSAVATNSFGVSTPATTQITATAAPIQVVNPPALTANIGSTNAGNAATELAPSGGTTPYSYSNDTGNPSCSAVSGATALPNSSLTVNSGTGSYSYTAPATPGVYYFCIKVCDATPTCVTKTYTLTVVAPAGTGTLDCSTAQISGIVAGTPGNGVLKLNINVSQAGQMSVSVTGSGLATSPNPYMINPTATGTQTFYVPLTYSGATFAAGTVISVTGAGSCTVDMTAVVPRTVSTSVLNLGPACAPATAATLVK